MHNTFVTLLSLVVHREALTVKVCLYPQISWGKPTFTEFRINIYSQNVENLKIKGPEIMIVHVNIYLDNDNSGVCLCVGVTLDDLSAQPILTGPLVRGLIPTTSRCNIVPEAAMSCTANKQANSSSQVSICVTT